LDVEIGFGVGEFLVESALKNPKRSYVGIEKDWERIYKALKRIEANKTEKNDLSNVKILKIDASIAFERLFLQKSIDNIYCLFPCPWPKKRHVKFRLFSSEFLCLLNSRLKDKGTVQIVTDFHPYFQWILERTENTGFAIKEEKVSPQYDTKFEKKWREQGQEQFYKLTLRKKKHIDVQEPREATMKSYKIVDFNPRKFKNFIDNGDCSVVVQDYMYDDEKQLAMVQVVVAEKTMTQNFRIMIAKKKDSWCIAKAGGQMFFPTTGIAKALKLVYEEAKNTA